MRVDPYQNAPRLPEGSTLDLATLLDLAGGAPVELEIGPGRGGFIFERLEADPAVRLLGLEIRRKWATIVDRRLTERGHGPRARVFAEDARATLPRLPEASIRAVFVHFPDPWWKKRHEKRLVLGDRVVAEIARVLVDDGELFVQTDVEERALAYAALVEPVPELVPSGDGAGPLIAENPYGARSPREHRALADGLPVHRYRWRRRPR